MRQKSAPGDLAAELAVSRGKRDAAAEAADKRHADVRASVLDRGALRITQISSLVDELRKEQDELKAVLAEA